MALPPGKVIALSHTKELEPGDLIHIVFAPGHLGFFKYGSEAIFAVVKKTSTGEVVFRDRSGSLLEPLGGSKDQLLASRTRPTLRPPVGPEATEGFPQWKSEAI